MPDSRKPIAIFPARMYNRKQYAGRVRMLRTAEKKDEEMNKFIGHLGTVCRHRHKVFVHCVRAGIPLRGLLHDLSKFSPAEFIPGVKNWQGTRSPNETEREKYGYSRAWMHHKGRNLHHYEYWNDFNPKTRQVEPVKMPPVYFAEMFCDRVAASKTYQGKNYTDAHPLEYFRRGRPHMFIHEETAAALEKVLTVLAEEGEDAAFALVREIVKNGY